MFRENLKVTLRVIKKQKVYSTINALGLALGMTVCFLVISFIVTELSYDRYHENADRIYRITANLTLGKTPNLIATTNAAPAPTLVNEFEGVIDALRIQPLSRVPVKWDTDVEFYEDRIYYAEPSIFNIFSFPIIKGDPSTALVGTHTMVLTESTAKKYFGKMDPMGKVLKINDKDEYTITGVIKDVPFNSHFVFDMLLSYETLYLANGRDPVESWSSPFYTFSYVLLDPKQEVQEIQDQFPKIVEKYIGDSFKSFEGSVEYFLQPVTEIHLYSTHLRHEIGVHGDIKYVYIFGTVAIFVLLIACFNFMNLSTARSTTRSEEVGMRKILGATRRKLIIRFLTESVVFSLISLFIALWFAKLCLPYFSNIAEKPLSLSFLSTWWVLIATICFAVLIGIFAGIYPALFLSSFRPIQITGSNLNTIKSGSALRAILVIVQFVISIILIIGTNVVFKQLQFLQNKNLGFNKEQVVVIPILDQGIRNSLESIKAKFSEYPDVLGVAASSHVLGLRPSGGSYLPEGYDDGESVMMDGMSIDYDYLETMGMELVAGRTFSRDIKGDSANSILITETAAREIGWRNALNKTIKHPDPNYKEKTVIGVVKDFFFKSPHKAMRGIYISLAERPYRAIFVKIAPTNVPNTIEAIKETWREIVPNRSLDYYFLDESYDQQFRAEERLSTIFLYFTLFAIFIACLGLFGMSSFNTEQRYKEIGIRKSLGATTSSIVMLLSKNIIKTILISSTIALPLAYYVMELWLQNFEFRTNISFAISILAILTCLSVAFATVSLQSIGAARSNPVDALRHE